MGAVISTMVMFVTVYLLVQLGVMMVNSLLPGHGLGTYLHFNIALIQRIEEIFMYIMSMIFWCIVWCLLVIYIVWWVIKTFIPEWVLFIPLRMMFLAVTPFPPLTDAGILPLYDNIVGILFSGDSIGNRLIRFIRSVTGFLAAGEVSRKARELLNKEAKRKLKTNEHKN